MQKIMTINMFGLVIVKYLKKKNENNKVIYVEDLNSLHNIA